MKPCAEFKETLVLDVHGELAPEDRRAWEQHLAECRDCTLERERLLAFVRDAKATLSVPALTPEEEQRLSTSIQRTLRSQTDDARPNRAGWLLAPACAACMVLVVAGWFGLKNFKEHSAPVTFEPASQKIIPVAEERPEQPKADIAAAPPVRVAETVIDPPTAQPESPAADTVAAGPRPSPEENIRVNKELLEYMDMLQAMDSLEQLVNLLDKKEHETSLLEQGDSVDRFRTHV